MSFSGRYTPDEEEHMFYKKQNGQFLYGPSCIVVDLDKHASYHTDSK